MKVHVNSNRVGLSAGSPGGSVRTESGQHDHPTEESHLDRRAEGEYTSCCCLILYLYKCAPRPAAVALDPLVLSSLSLSPSVRVQDSELNELRKTIELLKKQNLVAQAAINGVINTPELTHKGDRTGTDERRACVTMSYSFNLNFRTWAARWRSG